MPIPLNITREHILQAIQRVDNQGVPEGRESRRWAVRYNNHLYPCKLLISWANIYVNNEELDPNPNVFTTQSASKYLKEKNFEIIRL